MWSTNLTNRVYTAPRRTRASLHKRASQRVRTIARARQDGYPGAPVDRIQREQARRAYRMISGIPVLRRSDRLGVGEAAQAHPVTAIAVGARALTSSTSGDSRWPPTSGAGTSGSARVRNRAAAPLTRRCEFIPLTAGGFKKWRCG